MITNDGHFFAYAQNKVRKYVSDSGPRLAQVNIIRGIFQGDSLSPLLFIAAMIPMTRVLERMEVGYQLKKGGSGINHPIFMDGIKLFG